jgi:dihydrofolate reductase
MTSFVYYTATSLNGFIADEANSLDWLFEVGEPDPSVFTGFVGTVGLQVMGSTTYEWLLAHERLLDEPEKWAGFFGTMPTKVFSSRTLPVPRGADVEVLAGSVQQHAALLREAAAGKDVWVVGGGDLAGQFLDAGLLDRIDLTLAPVFLAGGAPLLPRFASSARVRLVSAEPAGRFARLVLEIVS